MATGIGRILHLLSLPCEGVSHLTSESLDRPLTRGERAAISLHTLYCSGCRRFRKQVALLREAARHLARHTDSAEPAGVPSLSPEALKRLHDAVSDAK